MAKNSESIIKEYYKLTKPGIIYGNLIAAAAGFLFAARIHINPLIFLEMLAGTAFIIGSACVFNNCLDRDIDSKMDRTKKRAIAAGRIPVRNAIIFAGFLGLAGSSILISFVNLPTFLTGAVGFFFYVFLYTPIKKHSTYGTLVGSVSGATPPVAGYVAVTGRFDQASLLLFIALVVWQMPHFYSIAIFRIKDYASAKIPVLPIVRGIRFTKITMTGYVVLFMFTVLVMKIAGYIGLAVFASVFAIAAYWLYLVISGFAVKDNAVWARKAFRFSLIVLLVFCLGLSLNVVLP